MVFVQVDERYRITLPKDVREGITPGDTLFVDRPENGVIDIIRIARAVNPFDALAEHAIKEYEAGRTFSLDQVFGGQDDSDAG